MQLKGAQAGSRIALTGKVALVTGASRGIGAAVARMLGERGADVIVNYRSKPKRADRVAEAIRTAEDALSVRRPTSRARRK